MNTPDNVKTALQAFVKSGKGFVGNHGAGDNWHDWPEGKEMLGAEFITHPYGRIQIKVDDPASPLTSVFGGKAFPFSDEIYAFKEPYSREKLHLLLSIDYPNSPEVAKAEAKLKERAAAPDARQVDKDWIIAARPDHDYAIAWIRRWGEGRVFYCALGHVHEATWNPNIVRFNLAGIQYALGDLKADDAPGQSGK
jgi:type 1 glutamine amidotransferase